MGDSENNAENKLIELYRARLRDRLQAVSRRRRQVDARPRKLGDLLNDYFKQSGEAVRRIEESRAVMAWPHYVGQAAARVSQAIRIRDGTLLVRVDNALWMQQLSLLKFELLNKYRADFPRL